VSADLSTYDPVTNSTVGDQMPDLSDIMTEEQVWDLVKFGQPGTSMGSLVTDINDILDLYAALTDETMYPDPAFELASGINGGTMYDKFWTPETGWDQSDPNLATFNTYSNFFRCKQCHAWDRLGNAASYIGRAPSTTRPNVSSLNLKTATAAMNEQELFDALWTSTGRRPVSADLSTYDPVTNSTVGDQMPDLSDIMTEEQVWDLVKFELPVWFDYLLEHRRGW
jgi:mono/diheme cytochrome c family protein